jgi:hypothetical protein
MNLADRSHVLFQLLLLTGSATAQSPVAATVNPRDHGPPVGAGFQTSAGSISGSVQDSSGSAVPAASVKLVHTATGIERESKTNELGDFVFASVMPGEYKLLVGTHCHLAHRAAARPRRSRGEPAGRADQRQFLQLQCPRQSQLQQQHEHRRSDHQSDRRRSQYIPSDRAAST